MRRVRLGALGSLVISSAIQVPKIRVAPLSVAAILFAATPVAATPAATTSAAAEPSAVPATAAPVDRPVSPAIRPAVSGPSAWMTRSNVLWSVPDRPICSAIRACRRTVKVLPCRPNSAKRKSSSSVTG